jgi:ATP-binding cassette subfamily C protein LapB
MSSIAPATARQSGSAPVVRLREDLLQPDPLLDCLVEVCRLHGQGASRASLSAGLPLVDGRLNLETAERAAARAGMAARLQRLPLAQVDPAALPAILVLRDNKACVLLGHDDTGAARVLLPETGQGSVTLPLAEWCCSCGRTSASTPARRMSPGRARRTGSGAWSRSSASSTATCWRPPRS